MKSTGAVLAVFVMLGAAIMPAQARSSFGDYVRAARALQEGRLDEARALLDALSKAASDDPETKYLAAEIAFLEGDYPGALALLSAMSDARGKELARDLLPLVSATLEATRGFLRRESEHFVFSYPAGKDEVLVDVAAEALEAACKQIGEDLGYLPSAKVRVEILPRPTDLARVSTLTEKEIETSGTIALSKYNKLMIVSPRATLLGYPWLDTLAHEYTHYVVTALSADNVPIWLHEGIAKFQETRWRASPGAVGLSRTHAHLLAVASKKGRLIRFEEMHPSMAKLPSQEAAATAFAEVYTMVAWLHHKVGYEGIRSVIEKIRDGRTERRAIAEVLGFPWARAESEWKDYLRKLDLKEPSRSKVSMPLRFRKGRDDGDENVGLDQVSEEKARKHARLGGLLRARGRFGPAALEYEKALAITGPDNPFLAGKLARTYLDMGEPRRAVEAALPLSNRDEEDAYPQATLGAAYLELGDAQKAEQHLGAALRISPFDPAVRCALAEVYAATGRSALATRETAACRMLRGI
ncbi:MAG: tetratricopeptide repeat protein [Deltaproteobacteria bacterium]|nr:tetratricopeptide repeat protein [Deltaproteobacteria bacterium]